MDPIPHLAWPLRYAGARYATVEQNTDAEMLANVGVILSFQRGTRAEAPAFGIVDPTFSISPIDTDQIVDAIADYEPRAEVSIHVDETATPPANRVRVRVRQATGTED